MTFEEYKKLAENPPFSDGSAIFKVEVYVIDSCGSKKYYRKTMTEPWKYSEIYCMTFEEAKQCLHNEMDQIEYDKYCAYIFQIPINENIHFTYYDRAWLYDHNGNAVGNQGDFCVLTLHGFCFFQCSFQGRGIVQLHFFQKCAKLRKFLLALTGQTCNKVGINAPHSGIFSNIKNVQ